MINQGNANHVKSLKIAELRDFVIHDRLSKIEDQVGAVHQGLLNQIIDLQKEVLDIKTGVKEIIKQNLVLNQLVSNLGAVTAKAVYPMFGSVNDETITKFLTTVSQEVDEGRFSIGQQTQDFRFKKILNEADLNQMAMHLTTSPETYYEMEQEANGSVQEEEFFDLEAHQQLAKRRHADMWKAFHDIKKEPEVFDAATRLAKLDLLESSHSGPFVGPKDPNVKPDPKSLRKNKTTLAKEAAKERGEIISDDDDFELDHKPRKQWPKGFNGGKPSGVKSTKNGFKGAKNQKTKSGRPTKSQESGPSPSKRPKVKAKRRSSVVFTDETGPIPNVDEIFDSSDEDSKKE